MIGSVVRVKSGSYNWMLPLEKSPDIFLKVDAHKALRNDNFFSLILRYFNASFPLVFVNQGLELDQDSGSITNNDKSQSFNTGTDFRWDP
jgi:hypothetical protein